MAITMERARECVNRPVIVELDDGETKEGVIQYVGRSYIKVLVEGQEDGWVMNEDQITWKPLLPDDTRRAIKDWFDDDSGDGHWQTYELNGQTMILSYSEEAYGENWQHHVIILDNVRTVTQGHEDASQWVGAEAQELRGWAKP